MPDDAGVLQLGDQTSHGRRRATGPTGNKANPVRGAIMNVTANDLLNDPSEVGNLDDATIQWLLHQDISIQSIGGGLAVRSGRGDFDPHLKRYGPNALGEFVLIIPVMADPGTTMLDLQAVDLVGCFNQLERI